MAQSPAALQRAIEAYRRGDGAGARAEAERALAEAPQDPATLHFLGALSCRTGAMAQGADYFRRAVAAAPGEVGLRVDLAMALAATGDSAAALAVCEGAADAAGATPLRRAQGQILQMVGRDAEAAAAYEQVVAAEPDDWEIWNNLGNARRGLGDTEGALAALRRAAALRPDVLPIHANLAAALVAADRPDEALDAYRRALPLGPTVAVEMARLLRHLGREEEALELLPAGSAEAQVQLERGRSLSGLRRLDEAERAYRAALGARPGDAEAWLELGILLERAGKADRLQPLLDEAASAGIDPDALALVEALRLQREGRIEEALRWAQRAPADVQPARSRRLVSRLADRCGQPGLAFAAAAEANRLLAEEHPGAAEAAARYRAHVEALARVVTPEWFASWRRAEVEPERPAPVFLVGFPRSGTTLLDTMLMGHERLHVLEELPLLDRVMAEAGGLERVARLDAGEVKRLRSVYFDGLDREAPPPPGAIVIDKLPLNILGAPLIHRLFPDARLILALRHPGDVVLSCFMQGFEMNDAMANFRDLGETARLYDLVLGFWQRCRDILPLDVFESRYEDLIAKPEGRLRALTGFVGVEWSERVLDHQRTAAERGTISTPSYNQVTQKLYGDAAGRWRRYRDELAPVWPILAPWAERFGYDS